MKILSVDDDPVILELLEAVLASIGYLDVTTAESAAEALELVEQQDTPFDCFLLDIQMPDIDGIQLCKALRMMPDYSRSPILMITAMSDKSYIDKAFTAGATDYVTKPFDVLELGARVRTAASLVEAWQQKTVETLEPGYSNKYIGTDKPFAIDEKFTVDDVEGVISYIALENYVSQLSRGSLFGSTVLAFSIVEIDQLFNGTTAFDFESLITDVAEAITICLQRSQSLVSYAGNGTFACIIESAEKTPLEILEQELREVIASMELCYSDGRPILFSVVTGKYIRLTFRSGQNVVNSLSEAARAARFKSEDLQPARAVVPLDEFLDNLAG